MLGSQRYCFEMAKSALWQRTGYVNDCYTVIHASVETVFGLYIYVYFLLVICFFFVFFYEYLKWIESYCIFDREGEVASSWMLHEEMFERVNATKENVYIV